MVLDINVLRSSIRLLVGRQFDIPLVILVHINCSNPHRWFHESCTCFRNRTTLTSSGSATYPASEVLAAVFLASLNAIRLSPSTVLPLNQTFAVLVSRQTPKFELIYSSRRSLQPSPPYVTPHPFVCRPRGLTDRARIVQPCRRLPTTE